MWEVRLSGGGGSDLQKNKKIEGCFMFNSDFRQSWGYPLHAFTPTLPLYPIGTSLLAIYALKIFLAKILIPSDNSWSSYIRSGFLGLIFFDTKISVGLELLSFVACFDSSTYFQHTRFDPSSNISNLLSTSECFFHFPLFYQSVSLWPYYTYISKDDLCKRKVRAVNSEKWKKWEWNWFFAFLSTTFKKLLEGEVSVLSKTLGKIVLVLERFSHYHFFLQRYPEMP